jgi:hypothetical protein
LESWTRPGGGAAEACDGAPAAIDAIAASAVVLATQVFTSRSRISR